MTFTKNAEKTRNYMEHLLEQITNERLESTEFSFGNDGLFGFGYTDISNKGEKFQSYFAVGEPEIRKLISAYDKMLLELSRKR